VNFKNTIIIMTSNIGARFIQKKSSMGFQSADTLTIDKSVSDMVLGEVKRTFNPEFINRIDEIIVFEALGDEDLRKIAASASEPNGHETNGIETNGHETNGHPPVTDQLNDHNHVADTLRHLIFG